MKLLHSSRSPMRRSLAGAVVCATLALFPAGVAAHTLVARESGGEVKSWSWLGVHNQGQVKFYRFALVGKERQESPYWILNLPETADEVVLSGNRLVARTGRSLRCYDTYANFRRLGGLDLELQETPNGLLLDREILGVWTGHQLKFYDLMAGFRHLPAYDHTVPAGASDLVLARNVTGHWLGVREGARLTFYDINRGYRPWVGGSFTLPRDVEETAVVGVMLLVKIGDEVAIHDLRKGRVNEPRHVVRLEPGVLPELHSLHGTMFAAGPADSGGYPVELWAKGDSHRTELVSGDHRVTAIQRGATLFVSDDATDTWDVQEIQPGLAAMGLVRQVAEVKARGTRSGAEVIDGILHYRFIYNHDVPRERVVAFISATNSLPRIWVSTLWAEDGTESVMRMFYRNLEANVEIPDAMFTLPAGARIAD